MGSIVFNDEKELVLVVEPDRELSRKIRTALTGAYQTALCRSAHEARACIGKDAERIALILTDIQTADRESLGLLESVKNDELLRYIPVIVMTADKDIEAQCMEIGVSDCIRMPCDPDKVVPERVQQVLEEAARRSSIDELTGLMNEQAFYRHAEQHDHMYPDTPMDAVCVDVSCFHIINDMYGREHGDRVLAMVARALEKAAQEDEGVVCRKTADIFLLYLKHRDEYQTLLDELHESLQNAYGDKSLRLKMGVYPDVDMRIDVPSRFERARLAGNTIHYDYSKLIAFYKGEKYHEELINQQLMREIDAALMQHQFKVYYQPKFSVRGDRPELIGAEALVRWRHPTMGVLYPGSFVPVFEENGHITRLDRYVWEETAEQIRRWRDKFGFSFPISVNVSRVDLVGTDLATIFLLIVHKNGIDPKDMTVEITESAYTENTKHLKEQIKKLHKAGFHIEIDDFGTGNASPETLRSVKIDAVKLDIGFVRDMFDDEKGRQLVDLITMIKESLRVPIVAEGVETEEQLTQLMKLGCDVMQGFYFSRPIPPEDFELFLEDKKRNSGTTV